VKKRNKRSGSKMILVSIVIAINLAGINYAQWNEGMKVKASIKTGVMDAEIVTFNVTGQGLQGAKNGSDLNILGTMTQGQTATVAYSVKNLGTLPVKFGPPKVSEKNGLKFDLTSAVKGVDGKLGGNGQFQITACDTGNYLFTVELPYSLDAL